MATCFLHLFVSHFFDPTVDNDVFYCKYCKVFTQHRERAFHGAQFVLNHLFSLSEKRRTIAHCLFAKPTTIKFQTFCVFYFCIFGGASTLVRAAMDSDNEIFLTQNTFSQGPFSPELNLEEFT